MDKTLGQADSWLRLAGRYIWWQPPQETVRNRRRLVAQVMNLGTLEDVAAMRAMTDDDALREALASANPGEFSERSWYYWHQMLGEGDLVEVPPLPVRTFGAVS